MVDQPTARNRLRKQELGTNTNSWGDTKLNEVLDATDQAMDGYLAIAITGDTTLTTTNYSTADQAKRRVLKFTGALAASANITIPSVEHEYAIINAAGADIVVKTFAGVGVTIPNGYQARVYCDSIDVFNGSPTLLPGAVTVAGQIHAVTAGTAATDAVNKTQMETAIATAGLPATAGTFYNSSTDTTPGYAAQKVIAQTSGFTTNQVAGLVAVQTQSLGSNEKLGLGGYVGGFLYGGRMTSPFTAANGYHYDVASGMTFILESAPLQSAKCSLALFNPTATYQINPNTKKINNSTSNLVLTGGQSFFITYDSTSGDWE